jgi:cytochrome oxidase Cu insertion factor (SCO1/SenC/PrrC family)
MDRGVGQTRQAYKILGNQTGRRRLRTFSLDEENNNKEVLRKHNRNVDQDTVQWQ